MNRRSRLPRSYAKLKKTCYLVKEGQILHAYAERSNRVVGAWALGTRLPTIEQKMRDRGYKVDESMDYDQSFDKLMRRGGAPAVRLFHADEPNA